MNSAPIEGISSSELPKTASTNTTVTILWRRHQPGRTPYPSLTFS